MDSQLSATKRDLLLTAERLFAEQGWEAVSLRSISSQAGQRNTSALQYHYGDKLQILEAILDYRMTPMNTQRARLLAQAQQVTVTTLLEILIAPLVHELTRDPSESYYISLLAQLHGRQRDDILFPPDKARTESVMRIRQQLRPLLPRMSEQEWEFRQELMGMAFIHGVAAQDARRRKQNRRLSEAEVADLQRILVQFLEGALRQH